jgi:ABC-2 type transport system permease protein
MNNLAQAIWVETLKARRSKMPLLTALAMLLIPLVGGLFMIIIRDPEFARQMGLISTKARLTTAAADWPAFLGFMSQAVTIGGFIVFCLIGSWVFGREYSDRTAKDLLALPTARESIVLAKYVVIAAWSAGLVLMSYLFSLVVGSAVALPAVPSEVIVQGSIRLVVGASLTIVSIAPIVFFASAGHGYLPPMGVAILAIVFAQVTGFMGWGEYFPWAVPALVSQGAPIGAISVVIVLLAGAAGVAATFLWWVWADQTH